MRCVRRTRFLWGSRTFPPALMVKIYPAPAFTGSGTILICFYQVVSPSQDGTPTESPFARKQRACQSDPGSLPPNFDKVLISVRNTIFSTWANAHNMHNLCIRWIGYNSCLFFPVVSPSLDNGQNILSPHGNGYNFCLFFFVAVVSPPLYGVPTDYPSVRSHRA